MLRDEEAAARLAEVDRGAWDRVYEEAIALIFEASGEEPGFATTGTTTPACAARLWSKLAVVLDSGLQPAGYPRTPRLPVDGSR